MRIGMVCEGASDHRTATTLASRVLGRPVETTAIDPSIDQDPGFSRWTKLDRHPQRWPRYHLNGRRGSGEPVHGQTLVARKALLLFTGKAEAVVLMADGDREGPARRAAMERARIESTTIPPERIVVAVPMPEREAWHLAGFEPQDEAERDRLAQLRTELGKDPRTHSHDLKHGRDEAKSNSKRILRALTEGDDDREHGCVAETPIDVLRSRGGENGLRDFLDQALSRLEARL